MAIYDRDAHKIVIRVAYDGPARAGKTTNLEQICASFTLRRRGELITPEQSKGRTQFFDWLDFESGLVEGVPIRCQLIAVPGQDSLQHRRRMILEETDVAVFVCEATTEGIADAKASCELLHQVLQQREEEHRPLPVIIQANKQDLPQDRGRDELPELLGLAGATTIASTAQEGVGVRETLAIAIRAAAGRLQKQLKSEGVDSLEGVPQSPDELLLLMKVGDEVALAADLETTSTGMSGPLLQPVSDWDGDEVDEFDRTPTLRNARSDLSVVGASSGEASTPAFAGEQQEAPERQVPWHALPNPMVPSDFIWPRIAARGVVAGLQTEKLQLRDDWGSTERSEGQSYFFQAGTWVLKTSTSRQFQDLEEARKAMAQLASKKVKLGSLFLEETVLTLCPASDSVYWLWTLTPFVETLHTAMKRADLASDDEALARALCTFADASLQALALSLREQISLDICPSNFGAHGGHTVYIDDDIIPGELSAASLCQGLLLRAHEYEHRPAVVERYIDHLASALESRRRDEQWQELDLVSAIESTSGRSPGMRDAKRQLLGRLQAPATGEMHTRTTHPRPQGPQS